MILAIIGVIVVLALLYFGWDKIVGLFGSGNQRMFTREELSEYDGRRRSEVYLGCKGYVFDVSKSQSYRPGSTYNIFAGKDATVGLAKMSLDPIDLESNDISRLKEAEIACLDQWFKQFKEHYKYPIVGIIVDSRKGA